MTVVPLSAIRAPAALCLLLALAILAFGAAFHLYLLLLAQALPR
ncbi:MAG TPA: hypothetical protein VF547_08325 [Allosphingosinicella sp.]